MREAGQDDFTWVTEIINLAWARAGSPDSRNHGSEDGEHGNRAGSGESGTAGR
jgi:hypothetical protein